MNIRSYCSLIITMLLCVAGMQAQSVNSFAFHNSTATFTSIVGQGGTNDIVYPGSGAGTDWDDDYFTGIPIGFTFSYLGNTYTTCAANVNGFMMLGGTAVSGSSWVPDLDGSSGSSGRPVLAPFWSDMELLDGGNGYLSYRTDGTSPNRVFTIEWNHAEWTYTSGVESISFQVKLYETTGIVEFNYQQEDAQASTQSIGVGISAAATGSGSFINITNANYNTISTTTETTVSTRPNSNTRLRFTPIGGSQTAPTSIGFTNVTNSSMTVGWTNNLANAVANVVFISTDNTNFTQTGFVNTTGTGAYSLNVTGLSGNTTYYVRVYAVNNSGSSTALTGSQTTASGTMVGTYTIGPSGASFTSVKMAIDTMNAKGLAGAVVFELLPAYTSSVETFPLTFGSITGASSTNTITFRPATGATNLTITGSNATAILDLNGIDYLRFDGRPGGSGITSQLTISNTSATTTTLSTVRFINDATFNTFTYCTILGATINTTTGSVSGGGTIHFSTGTSAGNSNNTISNCNIGPVNSTTAVPYKAVYAYNATTSAMSLNNTFSNCNIYDMFYPAGTNYWFYLGTGNAAWVFNGNSIYQTQTRSHTASNSNYVFYCASSSVNQKYTFNGNYIGGTAPQCGGTPMTINIGASTTLTPLFYGIYGTRSSSLTDTMFITNNTFSNISWTTASTSSLGFNCVYSFSGPQYIVGNTFGSATATGSIVINCVATGTTGTGFTGAYAYSSSTSLPTIMNNNTVGGISMVNTATASGCYFQGLYLSSTTGPGSTISNNVIGNATVSNSISTSTGITGTVNMRGIYLATSTGAVAVGVTNNLIANITCNGASTTSGGQFVHGIYGSSGIHNIANNTIRDLRNSAPNASSTNTTVSVVGINQASTTTPAGPSGHTISGNTIHTLINTNTTTTGLWVVGISANSATASSNLVERNTIHSLRCATTTTTASCPVVGMLGFGGPTTYQNNMIRLGYDEGGNPISLLNGYQGFQKASTTTINFWNNSIYIGGTVATGAANSLGIWRNGIPSSGTDDIRNNVVQIARSGGTGSYICMNVGSATPTSVAAAIAGLNINNNVYYHNGAGGFIGAIQISTSYTGYSTMSAWRGAVVGDGASGYGNPNYINPTGSSSSGDLHISSTGATPIEGNGAAISSVVNDYDGQTRSGLTPNDIGADAGNFTATDIFPPTISYTPIANSPVASTKAVSGVDITDYSGVNTTSGTRPRLYYKKIAEANTYAGNTSTDNGWKWVEANGTTTPFSFTINYSLLNSSLATGDTIVYFVIAQDVATTPNVGFNTGVFTADPTSVNLTATNFPMNIVRFYRILPSVSGTINVGPTETINSITNTGGLFEYINNRVVVGNVTAQITGNLISETGTVALNQTSEDGTGGYTVTIRPAASTTDTISGSYAGGLIRLNGADRVVIDGRRVGDATGRNLTVHNTSTTGSVATIQLVSLGIAAGAVNDTIRYCNLGGGQNTNSTSNVIFSGSTINTAGSDNDNLSIENNAIYRSYYGIRLLGVSGSAHDNINISGNFIGAQSVIGNTASGDSLKYNGITLSQVNTSSITSNTIKNISTATTNGAGILTDNSSGLLISKNVIDGIIGNASSTYYTRAIWLNTNTINSTVSSNVMNNIKYINTGNWGSYGLECSSGLQTTNSVIINNMISNVAHDYGGGAGSTFAGYGIRINGSGGIQVIHNTVLLRGTNGTPASGTNNSHAFACIGTAQNMDVRNNIFSNRMYGSSGSKSWCVYATSSATFTNFDYNILDTAGNTLQGVLGYYGGDLVTIAAFRTSMGGNQNTFMTSVPYADSSANSNLHLGQIVTNYKGTSVVSSIVSTDIDGLTRSNYIIGADEVKPVIQFTQQPSGSTICEGSNFSVTSAITTPITFDDGVTRTTPTPTYQWLLNGTPITGATNASYSVTGATTANAGSYALRVYASSIDSATSNAATVNVYTNASITTHPSGTGSNLCPGNTTFTLSVTATGTTPTYQWQKLVGATWTDISGATASTYRPVAGWATADSGSYRVVVSSTSPCSQSNNSNVAVVGVFTAASIATQPTVTPSNSRCLGDAFTLSASGAGSGVQYQWRLNSTNITGATNSTYSVTSATLSDYGTYDIVVSNTCNSVTSNTIVVSQTTPTSITTQPVASTTLCPGQTYNVSVVAAGASLTYQWQKLNGAVWSNISGATSTSFSIASVTATDAASYRVNVTGTCGTVTSGNAVLNVNVTTAITTQPTQPSAYCVGDNISISGLVAAGTNVTYQWQKLSGVTWNSISGATSSIYSQTNAQVTDSGSYRVVVSGTCGTVNSNTITIIVNSPITVTTHPAWNNPNKCTGESAIISATIAGTVSTYQWQRFNGTTWVNISGASASSYTLNNIALADSGDYRLLLTGPCSSPTTTNSDRLFVQQNVQITANPQGSAVCAGNSISLSVTTIGTVVSYQWQQDQLRNGTWTNISGATSSSYSKSNVTVADSGNYRVSIIGTCSAIPVVSTGASIVIQLPYSVTSQPTWPTTPTNVGQVVSLTVGYTGTANFQWQRDQQRNNNWVNVGTNTATYSYTVNTVADSGNYRCIVTGPCTAGSVTTSTAAVYTCQPPTFTSQPQQPGTLCPGGTLSLSVQVNTQGQTVTYQWQRDVNRNGTWTNISGATNTSYVNSNLQTTDAGFYRVQLTSSCNAVPVNSNTVDVVLNQPITVTTQPTSQTVCVGANISFTAAATGNNPTYQWFYNNAPISTGLNATAASATLQLTNVSAASAGSYKCFISGTCSPNGVFTNAATLTVNSTVTISQQPQNTTGCAGTPVTFSVAAQGTNVAYQWKFGASVISGATNATYSIASPTTANNGSYSVDVTSTCGNTTSNSATLTIYIPAAFSTQPSAQTVCQGTNISLSIGINADASGPTYQWRKNGADINVALNPTALSTTLVLNNATPSDNATYTCMVKTACQPNGIVSNGATLTVNPATSIATQPTGTTVCEGTSATLNVVAQGTSLTYQWKKNGTDIFGATNSSYVIPSVVLSDAGNYTVVVNGTCAPLSVTSNTATLAVNQRVQITGATLQNQTVCQGANVQFVTSAIGTGVTYQWRKNGAAITANSTALTATLSLTNVTPTDNGTYDCIVTGTCNPNGVATNSASLAVNLPVIIQTTPQNQSVCQGANVQFTTSATGSVLGYQWRYNGQPISGNATATTTTLVLNNVTAANNGTYDVIVNGVCNVPTSAPATLTVNQPIAITTQPLAQKGCIGSTITTFVTTSGNVLSYQWQKDGNDIPGMTTAVLTITNPTSASSGIYRCVVNGSSACGTPQIISNAVGVVIGTPVVITTQPQDKSVAYGSTVTVTVDASGAGFGQNDQLFYRWYKGTTQLNDDNRINGSTTGTLTIRGIQPSDVTADYTVVVLGSCGQATSRQFAIVVPSASINSQPQGSTICAGRPTVFSVSAVATVPNSTLSYQWYRGATALTDGGTISGASTALLQISSVAAADSGDYTVQILVQPGGARVTSNVAHLTVGETPTITTQPASQEVCADSKVTLSVAAKGIGLTYKWLVSGSTTVLGTLPTLEIAQVQPSMAGSYTVEITNICGAVTSSAAVITVNTLPSITEQPQGATVTVGGNFTVRVVATGSAPITYQWRKGGTDIPNATNSTFTKANADKTDEAEYTCIVRNGCGEVTTAKANVLVSTVSVGDAEQFGYSIQSTEPNPVSDVATVRYTVAQSGVIKITLTDVNGRTIATLCNDMQEAGNHSVLLRSGDLDIASGTYQITLVTPQGYTTTKRIVIVK
ncbi:MAG: immunoglobulin domain-containing protein [Bacteriodetes bacterium]|nr:immunoglobulin domain-containing protein [Bacteroidota bacterium]